VFASARHLNSAPGRASVEQLDRSSYESYSQGHQSYPNPDREPLANRCFATIESLDHALGERCLALTRQLETIRDSTLFHWWPCQPART
jgi:hypothetical protein